MAAVGVTGTSAANQLPRRPTWCSPSARGLQDFTTGSWALFKSCGQDDHRTQRPGLRCRQASRPAAGRRCAGGLERARQGSSAAGRRRPPGPRRAKDGKAEWQTAAAKVTGADQRALPSDAQVIGAVQRAIGQRYRGLQRRAGCPASCTSCGRPARPAPTTCEYGFSCMGYEIAGGLGVKMAQARRRDRRDGRRRLLHDDEFRDRDFGDAGQEAHHRRARQSRLSAASTGCRWRPAAPTSTTCSKDTHHETMPDIDFAAHAGAMGAVARESGVDRRSRSGAEEGRRRTIARP